MSEWLGRPVTVGDEPLGTVEDAVLDVLNWRLRYLVVDLDGRPVLLTPPALSLPAGDQPLLASLSREQIAGSPPLPEAGLTDEYEAALQTYYGWELAPIELETDIDPDGAQASDHLLRFAEIRGRALRAADGRAGRLDDFVVGDKNWAIFYMVVGSGGLFEADRQVLLPPTWVEMIAEDEIAVELSKETIQKSRPYEPDNLEDE